MRSEDEAAIWQSQLTCNHEIATSPYGRLATTGGYVMGFFKKLFSGATAMPEKRYYTFKVKCNRCGEIIEGRIDLDNDLSAEFEGENRTTYISRKGLIGSGDSHCFQQIEVELQFTSTRELIEQNIQGGTFVE